MISLYGFRCISLMANDVGHLFIHTLYILFSEISFHIFCSFNCIFYSWFFGGGLLLSFENSLHSIDFGSLLDVWFAHVFSHFSFSFHALKLSFEEQVLILMRSNLSS